MADPNNQGAPPDEYSTPIPQGASSTPPAAADGGSPDEYSTPIPQGASSTTPAPTDQPGFFSRAYETSGAKGIVDLGKQVAQRPIDQYHEMVQAAQNGDWKGATETASKIVFGGPGNLLDSKNPIYKAAEALIMQPVDSIKETYKEQRKQGQGAVEAGVSTADHILNPATRVMDAIHTASPRVHADIKSGNYAGAVGDVVGAAGNNPANGAVPLIGGAVQQVSGNIDKDLHDHNYAAVLGDAVGPLATAGIGKVLGAAGEAGEAAEGAEGATTGTPPPPPPGGSMSRAAATVDEMNNKAGAAPSDEAAAATLKSQVEAGKAADHAAVNDTAAKAHKAIDATHQKATAEALAKQATGEFAEHQGEQELQGQAAQAPGDEAITSAAKTAADTANQAMHQKYADASDQMQDLTEGTEVPYEGSPLHKAAQELQGQGANEGPVTTAVSKSLPGSPEVNAKLKNLTDLTGEDDEDAGPLTDPAGNQVTPEDHKALMEAHGLDPDATPEPKDIMDAAQGKTTSMPDLMKAYKTLGESSRKVGWATSSDLADQDIYTKLKKGVIDTIAQVANESGNPEAIDLAEQMNKDYRENVRLYENPAVKALRGGKLSDVDKYLTGGQGSIGNINTMKSVLGSHWDDFTKSSMQRMVADHVSPDGTINYKGLLNKLSSPSMKPNIRNAMYGQNSDSILQTLNNMKDGAGAAKEATGALTDADAAQASAKAGVGATAAGKMGQINDSISHIIGDGDVAKIVMDPERRAALQSTVGPDGMKKLGNIWLENQVAKASTTLGKDGQFTKSNFDADKLLSAVNKFKDSPEAVDALFKPDAASAARYDKMMSDMQNVSSVKKLVKYGVITPTLGAAGAAVGPWAATIAALLGPGQEIAAHFMQARSALDSLANHPYMWKAVGKAGAAVDASVGAAADAASATKAAGKALGNVAKTPAGKITPAAVYSATQNSLGGNDK